MEKAQEWKYDASFSEWLVATAVGVVLKHLKACGVGETCTL